MSTSLHRDTAEWKFFFSQLKRRESSANCQTNCTFAHCILVVHDIIKIFQYTLRHCRQVLSEDSQLGLQTKHKISTRAKIFTLYPKVAMICCFLGHPFPVGYKDRERSLFYPPVIKLATSRLRACDVTH